MPIITFYISAVLIACFCCLLTFSGWYIGSPPSYVSVRDVGMKVTVI